MPPPKRPSWFLQAQKTSLQAAMSFGMYLGSWAGPWPPEPSFFVEIPATISPTKGTFNLIFYVPKSYSQRTQSSSGTDDARWAKDVMQQLGAVVVSVEYRLAPEHTFPTAVQDSVDAILYLVDNAEELYLDRDRIILSGFSSGGNLAFTAPILLEQLRRHQMLASEPGFEDQATDEFDVPASKLPEGYPLPDFTIKAIIAWYPSVDFTQTRHERRNTNPHPEVSMPGAMSNMFDTAYIFNSHLNAYESAHPLLSPGTAPTELLDAALPSRVVIYTCQFDALQKEGELFATRIREELGREVKFQMVEGVAHAWDKMPNPIWPPSRIEDVYKDACDSMKDYL
ncbi:hypothetical protein TWF191_004743 [Orbilia oligospora]|uniref:Alpha/beta hydrolase fold-3 domain-containing protein n=1 Tax=Orbilia oligospora TaxID=2813651 RepID=A0A7C8UZJ1_ORBOL|nr:hypothetical protein TWF191_004743 [Orbilia oligospora]